MVSPSKIFSPPMDCLHCGWVLHSLPDQSCTEALIWNLYRNHISSSKFFLPLLLFPLILNWRRQTRRRLWAIVKNYLQTVSVASTVNALAYYLSCILRRLNDRFVYSCIFGIPALLASQLLWLAPTRVVQFFATGVLPSAFEAVLRQLNVGLVHSRGAQTLIFMVCSLVVLRRQQIKAYSGFWFIRPAPMPANYDKWSLGERVKQSLLELRTHLGIGLALDLINGARRKQLKKMQLKSTRFMLSCMGIYQVRLTIP
ncbi:GH18373 [Drosophila grimshawi]|uniref:GH18373 n=1 Tax=Drosophila grimshawi TaxID=7222 RepID=B4JEW2_DROGR|nr:GH18373 [Drosophila grimshawi]